jgi:hypothetical protein
MNDPAQRRVAGWTVVAFRHYAFARRRIPWTGLLTFESAKIGVELISALAKLVEAAQKSKNPNLSEVLHKLRGEAINLGRSIDQNLDEITREFKDWGIDIRTTSLSGVDREISKWNLPRRMLFHRLSGRLWGLATTIKNFYADVEAIFVCSQEQQGLAEGTEMAHKVRQELSSLLSYDAPIAQIIEAMRKAVGNALMVPA